MPETLTNADNFWLCMDEPTNLMVITAFMTFAEPVDYQRLLATIDSRLASFPRFRKRIVKPASGVGIPAWEKDPHYDLRSHVQRIALPAPGDKAELQEVIGNLATTPLDPNKPLWQVHLIENYGQGCILFYRIHHCIADGIALMQVLLAAADTEPDAPWPKTGDRTTRRGAKSLPFSLVGLAESVKGHLKTTRKVGEGVLQELKRAVSNPAHMKSLAESAGRLPTDAASVLAKHTVMSPDPNTPFKGKLGVRKQFVWSEPLPLDAIKFVGQAIGSATINDVLIATLTGAMRRYLKTRKVAVNELDLRVTVPVNIRQPGDEKALGNKFSLVFLPLPVYLKDPVLRLREVKRRMDRLKRSPDPFINFGLLSSIGYLPPDLARKAAQLFGNKASGVLTNVPGPRQPLYFAGRKIDNFMFWVPRSGKIGLGISILSYNGRVTLGVAADENRMPDPEVLLEGFEKEFAELLALVRSGRIASEPLVLHDRYHEARAAGASEAAPAGAGATDSQTGRGRCRAMTKSGKPCRNRARPGSETCRVHTQTQPEKDGRLEDVMQLMKELTE
jgi:diacylglycerol O-acyltransferase